MRHGMVQGRKCTHGEPASVAISIPNQPSHLHLRNVWAKVFGASFGGPEISVVPALQILGPHLQGGLRSGADLDLPLRFAH